MLSMTLNVVMTLCIGFASIKTSIHGCWIALGIFCLFALVLLLIKAILPPGRASFDAASGRIKSWSRTHHINGKILDESKSLKNSREAQEIATTLEQIITEERQEATTLLARQDLAVAHLELGFLYRMMNLFDKSAEHLNQAVDSLRKVNARTPENEVFWQKAEALFQSGHPYEAEQILKRFKSEPRKKDVHDRLSVALFRRAELNYVKGNYKQALEEYEESLKMVGSGDQSTAKVIKDLIKSISDKV